MNSIACSIAYYAWNVLRFLLTSLVCMTSKCPKKRGGSPPSGSILITSRSRNATAMLICQIQHQYFLENERYFWIPPHRCEVELQSSLLPVKIPRYGWQRPIVLGEASRAEGR